MSQGESLDAPGTSAPRNGQNRPWQFSIQTMLLVPLVVVLLVGMAEVIQRYSFVAFHPISSVGALVVMHALDALGLPDRFLLYAWLHAPGWAVLAIITLVLGLIRSRRAHFLAWALATAFLLRDAMERTCAIPVFLGFEVDLVENAGARVLSLAAFLVGIAAGALGWWIRGRRYELASDREATRLSRSIPIVIYSLMITTSMYGWTLLAGSR